MSNEELKKKIVEILEETEHEWTEDKNGYILQIYYDKLAGALIAAGIGDVSELKNHRILAEYSLIPEDGNNYFLPNTPLKVKQLYSGEEVEQIVKERGEYKRRAERAEKALRDALEMVIGEFGGGPLEEEVKSALEQAEKELAEEKKDD